MRLFLLLLEVVVYYRVLVREKSYLAQTTSPSLWRLLNIGVMCSNFAKVLNKA